MLNSAAFLDKCWWKRWTWSAQTKPQAYNFTLKFSLISSYLNINIHVIGTWTIDFRLRLQKNTWLKWYLMFGIWGDFQSPTRNRGNTFGPRLSRLRRWDHGLVHVKNWLAWRMRHVQEICKFFHWLAYNSWNGRKSSATLIRLTCSVLHGICGQISESIFQGKHLMSFFLYKYFSRDEWLNTVQRLYGHFIVLVGWSQLKPYPKQLGLVSPALQIQENVAGIQPLKACDKLTSNQSLPVV